MKKRTINSEALFLIRIVLMAGFYVGFVVCAQEQRALIEENRLVLFEDLVVSCPYKKVIDASMYVWGYIQMLHDSHAPDSQTMLVCDAISGRMVHVGKQVDLLLDECEQGTVLLTDDIIYLIDIFRCIEREYQAIARRRGKIIDIDMQPLYAVREKCIQLIMI